MNFYWLKLGSIHSEQLFIDYKLLYILTMHHHHHQKAFGNKSHTSHGQRPGLTN